MVSEQVATATVFLGAHASSLHRRGDAKDCHETFLKITYLLENKHSWKKIYKKNKNHIKNGHTVVI